MLVTGVKLTFFLNVSAFTHYTELLLKNQGYTIRIHRFRASGYLRKVGILNLYLTSNLI